MIAYASIVNSCGEGIGGHHMVINQLRMQVKMYIFRKEAIILFFECGVIL